MGRYRDVHERDGQDVAIEMRLIAASCKPGADVQATVYRAGQLLLAIHVLPEQLAKWHEQKILDDAAYQAEVGKLLPAELSNEERLDAAFFRAGAKVSMKWMDTGVVHQSLPFDVDEFVQLCQGTA